MLISNAFQLFEQKQVINTAHSMFFLNMLSHKKVFSFNKKINTDCTYRTKGDSVRYNMKYDKHLHKQAKQKQNQNNMSMLRIYEIAKTIQQN